MLKGYAVNQRLDRLERTVTEHGEKIDFFVRTSLPPVEGIFFNGQIFDAYVFATNLIKSAKKSLILINNYIDESVLLMLSKRNSGVIAITYTREVSERLLFDLQKHNNQYLEIIIREYEQAHNRFLIIDEPTFTT